MSCDRGRHEFLGGMDCRQHQREQFLFGRLGGQLVALGTSLRIISSGSTPAPGWISAEY